ncbi:phage infection protein [Lacticaseibacillus mingshuiensis]|uniref:phage infection protein n=1 Tax=Lacticaseibacillus mingshuiensis TaxID=2799574 RepID=UPI0019529EC7|nr:phage infection protein [Lacticaseibacillus mingshuiensis]
MTKAKFTPSARWHGSEEDFMKMVTNFFLYDYEDCGMVKWQGYFLSDHTAALKQQAAQEATHYPPLPMMSDEDIRSTLAQAYQNGNTVSIQVDYTNTDGNYQAPYRGKVAGYAGADTAVLDTGEMVSIMDMRHVDLVPLPAERL